MFEVAEDKLEDGKDHGVEIVAVVVNRSQHEQIEVVIGVSGRGRRCF